MEAPPSQAFCLWPLLPATDTTFLVSCSGLYSSICLHSLCISLPKAWHASLALCLPGALRPLRKNKAFPTCSHPLLQRPWAALTLLPATSPLHMLSWHLFPSSSTQTQWVLLDWDSTPRTHLQSLAGGHAVLFRVSGLSYWTPTRDS